jgi:hypothetical protein
MPYKTKLNRTFADGTVTATYETLHDDKPHSGGVNTWHDMTDEQYKEKDADVQKLLSKEKDFDPQQMMVTHKNYHDFHKFQKAFTDMVMDWGDEHERKGKGD